MINQFSKHIASFFYKMNIISKDEIDSYIYGFQIILGTILNWSIIFLIMLYTGKYMVTIIYMYSFLTLRHHTGGYHAKTPIGCCVLSIFAYILALLALNVKLSAVVMVIYIIILISSLFCIIQFAPIIHENNPVSHDAIKHHRKLSILFSLLLTLSTIILMSIKQYTLAIVLILAMFQVSISLLIQKVKEMKSI